MAHEIPLGLLVAAIVYTSITFYVAIMLCYQRFSKKIQVLDYLIIIFGLISAMGVIQILSFLKHEWFLFSIYIPDERPLAFDIIRNIGIIFMLVAYYFSEAMIRATPHPVRLGVIAASLAGYIIIPLYYINTGVLVLTSQIVPFMQPTRLDEVCYDIILISSLSLLFYNYYLQYKQSIEVRFRKNLRVLLLGIGIFYVSYLLEISEHFLPVPDINYTFFSIPMFLSIGYVYVREPTFAFYTPIDITLLQISTIDGHLLYAMEFESEISTRDYMISIGLSGLNSMLSEIVDPETKGLSIRSLTFNNGSLIFEKFGHFIAVIQAQRETIILRKSIYYLITEFTRVYHEQIKDISSGVIHSSFDDIDLLIKRCLPIIESKIKKREKIPENLIVE